GGMRITSRGFKVMTEIVRGIALKHAAGRLISVLEGGYDLPALAESATAHVYTLGVPGLSDNPLNRLKK
ncbi:MAG: hypothetical protein NTV79_03580, partial [Candidatus Aureabacteria bacterium]|nr:hypothetical protein [Candidatus Auribacterota bacterium]